jgi:hypothetical protein
MDPFDAFEERMTRRLAKMRHGVDVELNRLHGEAVKVNAQHNSGSIFPKLTAVQQSIEAAAEDVLTEGKELVDDAKRQGKKVPDLWLEATAAKARSVLIAYIDGLYNLDWRMEAQLLPGVTPAIRDSRKNSLAWMNGQVDDFERDIWRPKPWPTTGATTITNNTVHIGGNNSGVVQQAGDNAQQHASVRPDAAPIGQALDAFAAALANAQLDAAASAEIRAEIDTIRAQLTKPKPSFDIIRIATGAIGSVVAGVGANVLTPHLLPLFAAIGMS